MFTHTTMIRAVRGRADQLGQCLHTLQVPIQKMTGCLRFEVTRAPQDPELWQLLGVWQSDAALRTFFVAPTLLQVLDEALQQNLLAGLECEASS